MPEHTSKLLVTQDRFKLITFQNTLQIFAIGHLEEVQFQIQFCELGTDFPKIIRSLCTNLE